MTPKDTTARERKAREREAKRKQGLRPLEVWAHPDDHPHIKAVAHTLTQERQSNHQK
ncbi:MAG: hypothetical protein ACK40S_14730 [Burkholderiaceae bacterium]